MKIPPPSPSPSEGGGNGCGWTKVVILELNKRGKSYVSQTPRSASNKIQSL